MGIAGASRRGMQRPSMGAVFRHFRGLTPLAALPAIRLAKVHAELGRGGTEDPGGAVARRHGFTNASRFAVAFRRRFGEPPADVVRRASRL